MSRPSQAASNVVDVVDDRIMLGTEQIDIERFTSIVSSGPGTMYSRQNSTSSIYTNTVQTPPTYDSGNRSVVGAHFLSNSTPPGGAPPELHNSNPGTKEYMNNNRLGLGPESHTQGVVRKAMPPTSLNRFPMHTQINPNSVPEQLHNLLGIVGPPTNGPHNAGPHPHHSAMTDISFDMADDAMIEDLESLLGKCLCANSDGLRNMIPKAIIVAKTFDAFGVMPTLF